METHHDKQIHEKKVLTRPNKLEKWHLYTMPVEIEKGKECNSLLTRQNTHVKVGLSCPLSSPEKEVRVG